MRLAFFPNPVFGWVFVLTLAALLASASYTDLRRLAIPKRISLSVLAAGLLLNLARGIWLGGQGVPVWVLGGDNAFLGALDGLLFSLAGFGLGFGLFFVLWVLGACGGGDVKLFAALGAWIGPALAIGVLGGTVVLLVGAVGLKVVWLLVTRGMQAVPASAARDNRLRAKAAEGKVAPRLISYSLPLTIVTMLVALWVFRVDLHLAAAPQPAAEKAVACA